MKTKHYREYIAGNFWNKEKELGNEKSLIQNNHLCMASRSNHNIILRGQTGFDFDGVMHDIGDEVAQTKTACECLKQLIEEAGGSLQNITKITLYLAERDFIETCVPVVDEFFKGIRPCFSLIITKLALPDVWVEIDADVEVDAMEEEK